MTTIRLDGISRKFAEGREALKDVSLEIRAGELFVLLGPSGSGKTTLLRLIAGLDAPSGGQVWFGDRLVNRWSSARRRIAMVFQEPVLYPHRTVRQHLVKPSLGGLGLEWSGWSSGIVGRKWRERVGGTLGSGREVVPGSIQASLANLGLEPLLNRKPHQLSGGERQRVALGRAIVRDPAAFLFDEPFSSLDVATRWELRRDWLRVQKALARTTVFVTHDQAEAFAMADRMGVLVGGVLQQVGTAEEVYQAPATVDVARVTGDPPMNLWPGAVVRRPEGWQLLSCWWQGWIAEGDGTEADESKGVLKAEGLGHRTAAMNSLPVVLGVRPEKLRWVSVASGDQGFGGWLPGVVESLEFLGNRWMATVRPQEAPQVGWQMSGQLPGGQAEQVSGSHISSQHAQHTVEHEQHEVDKTQESPRLRVSGVEPTTVGVGQQLQLSCDAEDIHLFDLASGERLTKAGRS